MFLCDREFPFDAHEPEAPEHSELQKRHREEIQRSPLLYNIVRSREELLALILQIQFAGGDKATSATPLRKQPLSEEGQRIFSRVESSIEKIAISYRRSDTRWPTFLLYRELCRTWGEQRIFFDLDSIPAGDDFREHLQDIMQRSAVILAVMGQGWLGRRWLRSPRIKYKNDWVRMEIRTALEKEILIIPILVDDAPMPIAEDLPQDLEDVSNRQAVRIRTGRDFEHDLTGILSAIVAKSQGKFQPPARP